MYFLTTAPLQHIFFFQFKKITNADNRIINFGFRNFSDTKYTMALHHTLPSGKGNSISYIFRIQTR